MDGNRPRRHSLKSHHPDWKEKLRDNCLRRVRDESSNILWKIRSAGKQTPNGKEIMELTFRGIVSDELDKIKQLPLKDQIDTSPTKVSNIWEYDGLTESTLKNDSEELLLEMRRVLHEVLRVELIRRGLMGIPNAALSLRDEVIDNIKSLDHHNYQSVIDDVKKSNSILKSFGINLNDLEHFLERISLCASFVKEASEYPSVQVHIHKQQAKECVLERTLALESHNKHRMDLTNDINMKKEEHQRLVAERHQLQTRVCEISDRIKTLDEEITTTTDSLAISELTQTNFQAALDEAKIQLAEIRGDYSDECYIALFTRWFDKLEEAKECCLQVLRL